MSAQAAPYDPCHTVQVDAEYLRVRVEIAIGDLNSDLSYQRQEDAKAAEFQSRCDGQENKSAECGSLGYAVESLRFLRKKNEPLVQEAAQQLAYYRQEYQTANKHVFRCRQLYASLGVPPPSAPTENPNYLKEFRERDEIFRPPVTEPAPYTADLDLRAPNAVGDPRVRGPKRSRDSVNLQRIVPSAPAPQPAEPASPPPEQDVKESKPERITELPPELPSVEELQAREREAANDEKPLKRILTLPPELPSVEKLQELERQRLREALAALEEQPQSGGGKLKRILTLPPELPSVEQLQEMERQRLREALAALEEEPATVGGKLKRILTLPPELPSVEKLQEMERQRLREALAALEEEPQSGGGRLKRILTLPPELPSVEKLQELERQRLREALAALEEQPAPDGGTPESITEAPPELTSSEALQALERERLREALAAIDARPPPTEGGASDNITELPPELPALEEMMETDGKPRGEALDAAGDGSPESVAELPTGLPSTEDLRASGGEPATPAAPPLGSASPPEEIAATPQAPAAPETAVLTPPICTVAGQSSYSCTITWTNTNPDQGSFEIHGERQDAYAFLLSNANSANVYLIPPGGKAVSLPGEFVRTETGTQACWNNNTTATQICIQE